MKASMILLAVAAGLIISLAGNAQAGDSIFAVHTENKNEVKAAHKEYVASIESKLQTRGLEQLKMGRFNILLNPTGNGQYEVQVYTMVSYGNKQISSVYSSMYEATIEYGYALDKTSHRITRYHFMFPPNSLTGWANPQDFETFPQFDWGSKFPSNNCSMTFHSLEQYGREYLEAGCFPSRDSAITFAKKFITYVESSRGL